MSRIIPEVDSVLIATNLTNFGVNRSVVSVVSRCH